jgi:GNS1/SUR4 family
VCWYAVEAEILMGWITQVNNTSIHVFMYVYYGLRQLGYIPWWRKLLTTGQIIQFMSDCLTSVPFPVLKYALGVNCRGHIGAWAMANAGGISFYILFTQFYKRQYTSAQQTQKTQHKTQVQKKKE